MTVDETILWQSWPSEAQLQVMAALRRSHFDSTAVQTVCDLVSESSVTVLEPLHRFSTLPVAGYEGLHAFHKYASFLVAFGSKFAPADIFFCLRDSKVVDVQELLIKYAPLFGDASQTRYCFLPAATYMISNAAFDWIKARWNSSISLEDIGYAIGVLHPIDRPCLIRSLCEYLLFYQEISSGPFVFSKGEIVTRPVKGSIDVIRGLIEVSNESTEIIIAEVDSIFSLLACDDIEIPHGSDSICSFGPVQEILYQFVLRLIRHWQDERVFLSDLIRKFASCPTYIAAIDLILSAIVDYGIPIFTDELCSEGIFVERNDVVKLIKKGYGSAVAATLCNDPLLMDELDRSASALTQTIRYFIICESVRGSSPDTEIFKRNPFACSTGSLTLISAVLSLRSFIAGFRSDSYLEVCRMLAARMLQWVELFKKDSKFLHVFEPNQLTEFIYSLDQLGAEPEFSLLPWSLRNNFLVKVEQLRSVVSSCPSSRHLELPNTNTPLVFVAGLIVSSSFSLLSEYCTELIEFLAAGNEKFASLLPSSFWRPILVAFATIERESFLHITDIWLDFFLQKIAIDPMIAMSADDIDEIIKMTSLTFDTLPVGDICQALHNSARVCDDTFMVMESLDDYALLHYAQFGPNSLSSLISSYLDVACCWEWSEQIFGLKCARIIATLLSTAPKQFIQLILRLTAPTNLACLAAGLSYQLIRYPDSYCRIVKTIWSGVLSVFGFYGDTHPSFPAIVESMKCSDLDLSQLAAILIIVGNQSYGHVGALYNLSTKPVDWLHQWAKLNSESDRLISDTLGLVLLKQDWIEQFRSNRSFVNYDSSVITYLLHNEPASSFFDILAELLIDQHDFVRRLAEDMFVLISSSTSLLTPSFWKAAKIAAFALDDDSIARCLCKILDANNFVNLEGLLDVIRIVADHASHGLVEALISVSTCNALNSRIHCIALEILTVCADAGTAIDSLNCGFAQHADHFFLNQILCKHACQVLVALQRSHAAPIALRAALSSCSTSSTLLRLSYLCECNASLSNV